MHATDLVLRPAADDDLDAIERMARASAIGVTTLPPDRTALAARIARSRHAFGSDDVASGEEIYLFVLEDRARGRVVGTSGIAASAGFAERFYSYRNEYVVHSSSALEASNRIHTLHLCHDLTGVTLLTSFYIDPEYAEGPAPQLLSRARLLFIRAFADRFADRIAAESPGLADEHGHCPFWDAVGRRFFAMDYPQIERLSGGRSKSFIAALMPQAPVYVPLLPEQAQWAIGQLHPDAELPFSILLDEGFDADTFVDIFDGGPTVHARAALLKTVARAIRTQGELPCCPAGTMHLLAGGPRESFRATLSAAADEAAYKRLALAPGSPLWAAALDVDPETSR